MFILSVSLILLINVGYIQNLEVFSSMTKLKQTVTFVKDSNLTDRIVNYVKQQRNILDTFKILTGISGGLSNRAAFNVERPLDALKFAQVLDGVEVVKVGDLVNILRLMGEVRRFKMTILPTNNDIIGISRAILDAQEIYGLPSHDLVNGWFRGRKSRALTMKEQVDLVRSLPSMNLQRRYNTLATANRTLEWLLLAKKAIFHTNDAVYLYKPFLDVLNAIKCECSNFGYQLFNELQQYHSKLSVPKNCSEIQPERCVAFSLDTSKPYPYTAFEALCRGESVASSIDVNYITPKRLLKCRYVDNKDPRLMLEPLKVEVLNQEYPNIVIIHDVITDNESKALMSDQHRLLPGHKMKFLNTTTVVRRHVQWYQFANDSKSRHLEDKIQGRLSAFTELNTRSFEDLSILNFGSIAMEGLHYDTILPSVNKTYPNEAYNKLVTTIIYLNEVQEGGGNVFPALGIKVEPIKNAALLFTNLYMNGNVDMFSMHGSCPVMYGEKWTAYQWIMNHGQEFHYPCSLDKFK